MLHGGPACHGIRVHDDPKRPHRLLIIEYWDNEVVFTDLHMQTPRMQVFLKTAEEFLMESLSSVFGVKL
ncbi:antibiotic biosynthesis monooxygenase [Niabella sp.]|uniref:putative quinol monooxygenase n=1 Tax=Niabella sp. TaxID=1962976 RepID=UPI00345618FD